MNFKIIFLGSSLSFVINKYISYDNVYLIDTNEIIHKKGKNHIIFHIDESYLKDKEYYDKYEYIYKEVLKNYKEKIIELLDNCDKVLLISCLGGYNGSALYKSILEISNELNKEIYSITSLPFGFEGRKKFYLSCFINEYSKKLCYDNYIIEYEIIYERIFPKLSKVGTICNPLPLMDNIFYIVIDYYIANINKTINKEEIEINIQKYIDEL